MANIGARVRSDHRGEGIDFLAPDLVPGLEHQDVPQQLRVTAPAVLVLPPEPADEPGVQRAGPVQAFLADQLFRPAAQRPTQPGGQGRGESLLRAIDERRGYVTLEQTAQQ